MTLSSYKRSFLLLYHFLKKKNQNIKSYDHGIEYVFFFLHDIDVYCQYLLLFRYVLLEYETKDIVFKG